MERVNIFVPIYFREPVVKECVTSLIKLCQSDSPKYATKIILIDNRSNDELRDWLLQQSYDNEVVETELLDYNMGKGCAINKMAEKYSDFDYLISCDSDIKHLTQGWADKLVNAYVRLPNFGMVSPKYHGRHNPMPPQPRKITIPLNSDGPEIICHFGGEVAGGCFVTDAISWSTLGGYIDRKYGGLDGLYRIRITKELGKQCGYVDHITVEHHDGREYYPNYFQWKIEIQRHLSRMGIRADPDMADFADANVKDLS